MTTYRFLIEGFGNYSHSFGWDNGVNLSTPVYTEEDFEPSKMFMGRYVNEIYCSEHGGSRNITLIVEACTIKEALFYAKLYCGYYYPENYQDEDD